METAPSEFEAYVAAVSEVDRLTEMVGRLFAMVDDRTLDTVEELDAARTLLLQSVDLLDAAQKACDKALTAWLARVRRKVLTDRMAGVGLRRPALIVE